MSLRASGIRDVFTAFESPDGAQWMTVGTITGCVEDLAPICRFVTQVGPRSYLVALPLTILAACGGSSGGGVLLTIRSEAIAPPPQTLSVIWRDGGDGLIAARTVRPGRAETIVFIEVASAVPVERKAVVRGLIDGNVVAEGAGRVVTSPGTRVSLTIVIAPGRLPDADSDDIPDQIDVCPMLPGPRETCEGPAQAADGGLIGGAGSTIDAGAPAPDAPRSPAVDGLVDLGATDGRSQLPDARDGTAPADRPPDFSGPNRPPSVQAGTSQTVRTSTAMALLSGSVSDDGLPAPPGRLSVMWTKVSGPGTVTFGDPTVPATTARFSSTGSYVLRLSASDGAASTSADTMITVLGLDVALAGAWPFDEGAGTTARDTSGGGSHATLLGAVGWATGAAGSALDLTVGDGYAQVPSPAAKEDFGTGDFTISVWFKTAVSPGGEAGLLRKVGGPLAERAGYVVFIGPGTVQKDHVAFRIWSGGVAQMVVIEGSFADGRWHHVAGRKVATLIEVIVDGRMTASQAHALGSLATAAPLEFGGGVGIGPFDGLLDDARIYSRALSDAEIAALASAAGP